jgi:uncharacterized protein
MLAGVLAPLLMWRPRLIVLQATPYCNVSCDYCYLRHRDDRRLMTSAVIDAIRDKLFARIAPDAAPRIVWHAGEPTVVPITWYEAALEALRLRTPANAVFAIQTNGIAISADWIDFLQRSGTQVGLSIDGPQPFHDARRKTRAGTPTWSLVMESLHKLQSAGIRPNVITVLHRECLSAADDFYRFYRDNKISHVSFSIDEANGANATSSFGCGDYKAAMSAFLRRILRLAFAEGYPLNIREIERVAQLLRGDAVPHNEQVEPWDVVAIAANGDVTSFSPDFMELRVPDYQNFCFGNILEKNFEELANSELFKRTVEEIHIGVETCRLRCNYFGICGGGSPSNKMAENRSLRSGETLFCKLSIQAPADALVEFLTEEYVENKGVELST